jgi:hypothetical protein
MKADVWAEVGAWPLVVTSLTDCTHAFGMSGAGTFTLARSGPWMLPRISNDGGEVKATWV